MTHTIKFIIFIITCLAVFYPTNASSNNELAACMPEPIRVMAMGDSHFERGSPLVRFLERDLGMNYRVIAAGRRGWTSGMWRSRIWQWRAISRRADIVLISLSGNDRSNNIPASIFKPNIDFLWDVAEEEGAAAQWIVRPSDYTPTPELRRDGVHLTRNGARSYARILADIVRTLESRLWP